MRRKTAITFSTHYSTSESGASQGSHEGIRAKFSSHFTATTGSDEAVSNKIQVADRADDSISTTVLMFVD